MGSKRRIADDILPIMLNNDSKTFVDAFCGGCSVIERVPPSYRRIANDKNEYLIAMWHELVYPKKHVCETFPKIITKEMYEKAKAQAFEAPLDEYCLFDIGWIGFMASFNGKFFNGYTGHDVVGKDGKHRDYIAEYIANIKKDIPLLKGVEFYARSYEDLQIPSNSIIYSDPPYRNTTSYKGGEKFNYENFYIWCMEMKERGHKVFVSEYEMPSEFTCVWEKRITNSLSPNKTVRPLERLFTLQ